MKLGVSSTLQKHRGGGKLFAKVTVIFVAILLGVGLTYAYFTARASSAGELFFANICADFVTSDDQVYTTDLFNQQLGKIKPGDNFKINTIYLKNTGEYDVYALLEVTFNAFKSGSTTASYTSSTWYNLSGVELIGDKTKTTVEATLVKMNTKTITTINLTVPEELDNEYKSGTATLNIKAHVIQSLLQAETGVSTAVTASRLIYQNKDNADVEHTVYIRPNGGTYNNTTKTTTISQDRGTTITLSTPTREGYTFKSWSFTGDGSLNGSTYTFGKSVGSITAEWQANTYTVTFDANGGEMNDWNGNLFSAKDFVKWQNDLNNSNGNISLTDDGIIKDIYVGRVCNASDKPYYYSLNTKPNTQYTFSCLLKNTQKRSDLSDDAQLGTIRLCYSDGSYTETSFYNKETDWVKKTVVSKSGKNLTTLCFMWDNWYHIDLKEVVLNEGTTTNEFKGYKDQKAIEYDSTYGTLPTPTREGYTFNGWLGASDIIDLSMWRLHNGATYDELTGIIYLPEENSYASSPLIPVNNLKSIYLYTLASSDYSDALCYLTTNYYNASEQQYSGNGSSLKFADDGIGVSEWGWQRHLWGPTNQLLQQDCYYLQINLRRHSTYATQPYSIRNVQLSTSGTLTKTYVTSSTEMTTAHNHALVADWTKNTSTQSEGQSNVEALANNVDMYFEDKKQYVK